MNLISLMPVLVIVVLTGCGEESKIKETIKSALKDPSSAQFKVIAVSKSGNAACAEFNAKNSMGGYGDYEIATLNKHASDGWRIDEKSPWAKLSVRNCSQESLDIFIDAKPVFYAAGLTSTVLSGSFPMDDKEKRAYQQRVENEIARLNKAYETAVTITRTSDGSVTVTPKSASLASEVVRFVARENASYFCESNAILLKAICAEHNK